MGKKRVVVTADSIGDRANGLIEYFNYVNNIKHKNHIDKTSAIEHIYGDDSKMRNIMGNAFDYEMKHMGKRGHRKLESFAMSFDLTTPKNSADMSTETWKEIFKSVAIDCMKYLKLDENQCKEFQRNMYCNLHRQVAGNDHANLVIGKFFDGERQRVIEQRPFLNMLKTSYNRAVLKHDPEFYMSCNEFDETEAGLRKGRVKQWKYDLTQANKAKADLTTYKARLRAFKERFDKVDERIDKLARKLKNIPIYLNRYYDALETSDIKKINQAKKRYSNLVDKVDKSVEELTSNKVEYNLPNEVDIKVGVKEFLKEVNREVDDLSQKSGKKPPKRPKM